jgi:hypothetical protein
MATLAATTALVAVADKNGVRVSRCRNISIITRHGKSISAMNIALAVSEMTKFKVWFRARSHAHTGPDAATIPPHVNAKVNHPIALKFTR